MKLRNNLLYLVLLVSLSALLFSTSSCKDKCKGVTCNNGGVCNSGKCTCPSGYFGNNCEYSSIIYQNNTFTDVDITFNGTDTTLPIGTSIGFVGKVGDNAAVTASTKGNYGRTYTWAFNDVFPGGGQTITNKLNISQEFFYLKVSNLNAYAIEYLTVNKNTTFQTIEHVFIAADRYAHGCGYYISRPNDTVTIKFANGLSVDTVLPLIPLNKNATFTLQIQ